MKFSMSCAWNSRIHDNAPSMIQQIKELGINRIELNFALTKDFVCDIISMRDAGEVEVTSLHNFCPVPEGVSRKSASPDYYSLASLDNEERKKAIDATKETILTARRLKAQVAILHFGKVGIKDGTKELASVLDNQSEYERIKSEMIKERKMHAGPYLDKAIASLEELSKFAKERDIALGIETRCYYYEIPSKDEIGIILERFKDAHIGYWHDVGHAQLFENIGIHKHRDFLDRYKDRMIGMHLHDIKGIEDHLAPLQGEFDFSMLKPYISEKVHLVLEPHQPATAFDVKKGMEYLEDMFKGYKEL